VQLKRYLQEYSVMLMSESIFQQDWKSAFQLSSLFKMRSLLFCIPSDGIFFSSPLRQIGFGSHPASYPMCTEGKVAGTWNWPLASI